jgi:hypothetical protein
MPSSGMLCHMALLRINISEECIPSITRVTRIEELVIGNNIFQKISILIGALNGIISQWPWHKFF